MRRERDSLGVKALPDDALYGIFTQRARETFDLSGLRPHPAFLRAIALIKKAAARANRRLGTLPPRVARATEWAADRVIAGEAADAFVLDAFQAGAGTPTHMNVNEVIANLANERLGGRRGVYAPVRPHDHVNLGQSSNDVTPTALSPYLGYAATARLVRDALAARRPLRDVVRARGLIPADALRRLLAPAALTAPRATDPRLVRRIRASPAYKRLLAEAAGVE